MKQCFSKFKGMFLNYGSLISKHNFYASSSYPNFEDKYYMSINRANLTDSKKVNLG